MSYQELPKARKRDRVTFRFTCDGCGVWVDPGSRIPPQGWAVHNVHVLNGPAHSSSQQDLCDACATRVLAGFVPSKGLTVDGKVYFDGSDPYGLSAAI